MIDSYNIFISQSQCFQYFWQPKIISNIRRTPEHDGYSENKVRVNIIDNLYVLIVN